MTQRPVIANIGASCECQFTRVATFLDIVLALTAIYAYLLTLLSGGSLAFGLLRVFGNVRSFLNFRIQYLKSRFSK